MHAMKQINIIIGDSPQTSSKQSQNILLNKASSFMHYMHIEIFKLHMYRVSQWFVSPFDLILTRNYPSDLHNIKFYLKINV